MLPRYERSVNVNTATGPECRRDSPHWVNSTHLLLFKDNNFTLINMHQIGFKRRGKKYSKKYSQMIHQTKNGVKYVLIFSEYKGSKNEKFICSSYKIVLFFYFKECIILMVLKHMIHLHKCKYVFQIYYNFIVMRGLLPNRCFKLFIIP